MDKISELFIKLLDNSSLATLGVGIFLIVIGGSENVPLGIVIISLYPKVKLLLVIVGVLLIVASLPPIFKDQALKVSKDRNKESNLKIQRKIENYEGKILKLEELVEEIKNFTESRSDDVSLAVLDIISGIKNQAREFEKACRESRAASYWLTERKQIILQSIKPRVGAHTSETFRLEIDRYIELIVESLSRGKYITPKARNIELHIGKPFEYIEAIQSIKSEVKREATERGDLGVVELKRLDDCIDKLIENIRKENNL